MATCGHCCPPLPLLLLLLLSLLLMTADAATPRHADGVWPTELYASTTNATEESTSDPITTPTAPANPCTDPHSHPDRFIDGQACLCDTGYKSTTDPDRSDNNTCRKSESGYLGYKCSDVSDCNYVIHHVVCEDTCRCRSPYTGFNGERSCFDNAMGWSVAIKTAGITVLVLAFGFLIAFSFKGCSRYTRHRLRRRIPWLRRNSDISFHSDDFYVGTQAIIDRPPSYAEEDTDKPPAYEEVFPDRRESQGGVVNAGFCPDPVGPDQRTGRRLDRAEGAHAGSQSRPPPPTAPPAAAAAPSAVSAARTARGHRRGLSGPAAIHLGTAEEAPGATAAPESVTDGSRPWSDEQTAEAADKPSAPERPTGAEHGTPSACNSTAEDTSVAATTAKETADSSTGRTEAHDTAPGDTGDGSTTDHGATVDDTGVGAAADHDATADDTAVRIAETAVQPAEEAESDGRGDTCHGQTPPGTADLSPQPGRVRPGGELTKAVQCTGDHRPEDVLTQPDEVWEDIQL